MEQKKVVYIAGPISGVPKYWEAFERAEDELSAAGFIPLSPSRLPWNLSDEKAMQICMAMINAADAVLFLTGSSMSRGACLEYHYCSYMDKPFAFKVDALKEVLR